MKFVCDNCSTQYLISDDKVGARGVKVRCKRCGNVIVVQAAQPSGEPTDRTLTRQAPAGGTLPDAGAPIASAEAAAEAGATGERDELGQAFDQLLKDGLPPEDAEGEEEEGQETAVLSMEEIERQRARTKGLERDKIDRVFDDLGSSQVPAESGAAANEEWFVAIKDQQVGPLPLAEVERRFAAGEITGESLAWQSGMGDWQAIQDIPRLRYLLGTGAAGEKKDVPTAVSKPSAPPAEQWAPVQESSLASLVEDELAQVKSKPPAPAPQPAVAPAVADEPGGEELAPWEREDVASGEVARPPESFFDSSLDRKVPGTGSRYFEDTRHSQVIAGPAYLGGARSKSSSKVVALSVIAGLVVVVGGGAAFLLFSNRGEGGGPGPTPLPPPASEAGPVAPAGPDAGVAQVADGGAAGAADAGSSETPAEGADAGREVVAEPVDPRKVPDTPGERNPKHNPGKPPRGGGTTVAVKPPKPPDKGGDVKPPKPPDKPAAGGEEGLGPMTKETVMNTLRAYQRAMKGCVEQQLQRDPTVTGTLIVGFMIQNSGKVNEVNVLSEEHRGTFVAICISQVIKGIGFPRFSGPPFEVPRMPLRLGG